MPYNPYNTYQPQQPQDQNNYINSLLNQAFGGNMPNQQQMQQQMQLFQEFSASPEGIQAQKELNNKFTEWYNAKISPQPTAPQPQNNDKIEVLEKNIDKLTSLVESLATNQQENVNKKDKKGDKWTKY